MHDIVFQSELNMFMSFFKCVLKKMKSRIVHNKTGALIEGPYINDAFVNY